MTKFETKNGRQYHLSLTIGALKKLRDKGIDLMALDQGDPPLIMKLTFQDPCLLAQVVFWLVETEGGDFNEFLEQLDGSAFVKMQSAFLTELQNFFSAMGRHDMAEVLAAQRKTIEKVLGDIVEKIREMTNKESQVQQTGGM